MGVVADHRAFGTHAVGGAVSRWGVCRLDGDGRLQLRYKSGQRRSLDVVRVGLRADVRSPPAVGAVEADHDRRGGSSEYGGSKAAWLKQALGVELPKAFPRVKAFVWFNSRKDGDWPISTSARAQSAFAAGIASPYFIGNDFRDLTEPPNHSIPP